jgi:hypothetical protein
MLEMKIAVGVMLFGAMLAGGAYATKSGASAAPSLSKDLPVQSAPSATNKNKPMQSKKAKPAGKAGAKKVNPKAKQKPDNLTETPAESTDQSVLIKGVRG